MATVGSPFTASGTAQRLPDQKAKGGAHSKVVVRFVSTTPATTDSILIRVDPKQVVDANHADFILYDKESIEIHQNRLFSLQDISIIILAGAGTIYWGEV